MFSFVAVLAAKSASNVYIGSRLCGLFRRVGPTTDSSSHSSYLVELHGGSASSKLPFLKEYSSSASHGRCSNRIRHLHRVSRHDPSAKLLVGTINTRGLSWRRLDNKDKLKELILLMRGHGFSLLSLSDLRSDDFAIVHVEELC